MTSGPRIGPLLSFIMLQPSNPPPLNASDPSAAPAQKGSRWLRRADLFVRVLVRLYIGLLLIVLPWTRIWEDNRLLSYLPYLTTIALSGAVRGIASGLGLLNLWIAVRDAMGYREP